VEGFSLLLLFVYCVVVMRNSSRWCCAVLRLCMLRCVVLCASDADRAEQGSFGFTQRSSDLMYMLDWTWPRDCETGCIMVSCRPLGGPCCNTDRHVLEWTRSGSLRSSWCRAAETKWLRPGLWVCGVLNARAAFTACRIC
jgi:hypothetical protein